MNICNVLALTIVAFVVGYVTCKLGMQKEIDELQKALKDLDAQATSTAKALADAKK